MTDSAVDELFTIWVKVFGIPPEAKSEEAVKALTELVGDFKEVEVASLKKDDPVRVKLACLNPHAVNCSIIVYINDVGFKLRWEAEGFAGEGDFPSSDDLDSEGEDKADQDKKDKYLDEDKGGSNKEGNKANDKSPAKKQDGAKSAPPVFRGKQVIGGTVEMVSVTSIEGVIQQVQTLDTVVTNVLQEETKNVVADDKAMVVWKSDNIFSQPDVFESDSQDDGALMRRMDADLGGLGFIEVFAVEDDEDKCAIPTDSDIEKMRKEEEDEVEDNMGKEEGLTSSSVVEELAFQEVQSRKKAGGSRRHGLRVKDTEVPVQLKAEMRKSKINLIPGTSNPYAVFQSIDKNCLAAIALASNIDLGSSEGEVDCRIDAICAREKAQAELFATEKKLLKQKECVENEEVFATVVTDNAANNVVKEGGDKLLGEMGEVDVSSEDNCTGDEGARKLRFKKGKGQGDLKTVIAVDGSDNMSMGEECGLFSDDDSTRGVAARTKRNRKGKSQGGSELKRRVGLRRKSKS